MAFLPLEKSTADRLPIAEIILAFVATTKRALLSSDVDSQKILDAQARREAARRAADNLLR